MKQHTLQTIRKPGLNVDDFIKTVRGIWKSTKTDNFITFANEYPNCLPANNHGLHWR